MASLPEIPEGWVLEDLVAAALVTSGYYVDKSTTGRIGNTEFLELDVVATTYGDKFPKELVVEAKSGKWGFADIFKVFGWITYLGLDSGLFFATSRKNRDLKALKAKGREVGVSVICPDSTDSEGITRAFAESGFDVRADDELWTIWRFSFWVERRLIEVLRDTKKGNPTWKAPTLALDYLRLVRDTIFFEKDTRRRAEALYQAFKQTPRLASVAAADVAGVEYDPDDRSNISETMKAALYRSEHRIIHACMYVEQRARLAVLKAAVDYVCHDQAGLIAPTPFKLGPIEIDDISMAGIPQSFRDGTEILRRYPNFHLYPYFWQVFLWGWGGFYLTDKVDEEFDELSRQTGLPKEEIPAALAFYDELFPGVDWIKDRQPYSQTAIMKMMPAQFMGIGAFNRLLRFGHKSHVDFGYTDHTTADLIRWHNSGANIVAVAPKS